MKIPKRKRYNICFHITCSLLPERDLNRFHKDILREKVEEQVKHQVEEEHQLLLEKERDRVQKEKEEYTALRESLAKEIEEKESTFLVLTPLSFITSVLLHSLHYQH